MTATRFTFLGKETDTIAGLGTIFCRERGWGRLTPAGAEVTIVDPVVGGTGLFACARGFNLIRGKGRILSVAGTVTRMRVEATAMGRLIIPSSC